jgi:hypothetical protein
LTLVSARAYRRDVLRAVMPALVVLLAFLRAPAALGQPLYLDVPNPEANDSHGFGRSVAAYGDDILVGDTFASKVYLLDGDTGVVLRTFVSPGTPGTDWFGAAVAAVGTKVLVGAPSDGTAGLGMGAVYLFDGSTGALLLTIYHPGADYYGGFGAAVAAAGSNLLVGAPGGPYDNLRKTFLLDGSTGAVLQTYVNPSPAQFTQFGLSVAAVGGYVVVGAPGDPVDIPFGGAVYVFDAVTGAHVQTLDNPNPTFQDGFGYRVAAFGTQVLVGSSGNLAYRFDPASGTLLTTYPLFAVTSIATHAGKVLIGSYSGVYVFDPVTAAVLRNYAPYGAFPSDVASIGNRVVVASTEELFQDRRGALFSYCGGLTECGPCETCDASGACVAAPHPTCRAPLSGRSTLTVKDSTSNDRDSVVWTIGATFSDPPRQNPGVVFGQPTYAPVEHDYTLCMYDESTPTPTLVFQATAPAAGDCGAAPCWKDIPISQGGDISGYTYVDGERTPHGMDTMVLRATTPGGGIRLKVQAKGENLSNAPLGMATPPLNLPLRVQLHNRHGHCWEDTYTTGRRNVSGVFRDKSRSP